MGSNLVIAAIPDENDRVWKVSSEKIPHLTILHLGDSEKVSNLEQIMLFVEHAANTSLKRFYLPVDRRGELGADNADVLFFKKGRYDFKAVYDFRSLLLQDPNIKTAYDASTQFESPENVGDPGHPWIPHLTLGYPETPAKEIPDDQNFQFYDVQFNKIACWAGDFEGPDWLLKDYWDEEWDFPMDAPLSVAMSDLRHHGTKGMKWGQHKSDAKIIVSEKTGAARVSNQSAALVISAAVATAPISGLGAFTAFLSPRFREEFRQASAVNKGIKDDKKWNKQITSAKKAVEVHNASADEINKKIPSFNADKRWKNADGSKINLNDNPAKLAEYNKAAEHELMNPAYANAAIKVHGSESPSGRYKFEIKDASTGLLSVKDTGVNLHPSTVKHTTAGDDELSVTFEILRDADGHILGMKEKADSMTQTAELGAEFIEHYGAKGMKWGVRNATRTAARVGVGAVAGATLLPASPISMPIGVGIAVATHPTRARREAKIGKRPGPEDRLPKLKELPGLSKAGLKKLGRGIGKVLNSMGDHSWERSTYSDHKQTEVHNRAAEHVDSHLRKLQDSPKYSGKNLLTNKKLKDSYDEDVAKVTEVAYKKAVKDTYGSNVTNTKVARFMHDARGPRIEVREKKTGDTTSEARLSSREEIQKRRDDRAAEAATAAQVSSNPQSTSGSPLRHGVDTAPDITIPVKVDKNGLIVGLTFVTVSEDLTQTADLGAAWLAHHGVKGMKWGERRARGTPGFFETKRTVAENKSREKRTPIEARVQDSIGKSGKKKTTISSKGGEDHPATEDAIRVASAQQKLKKSGTHALSNKELQDVATRLNLEAQVTNLTKGNQSMGKKFIDGVFGRGSKEDRKGLENKAGQSAANAVGKKIAKKVAVKVATGGLA